MHDSNCQNAEILVDIKEAQLMKAVDAISTNYGRRAITLAKYFAKDGWQMKREFLSPCVTTDINNVPAVE